MTRQDVERISKIPMFFIVGRPRTGSTLLRTLFDAHPNVVIPQEWPMILALYRKFGHIREWDEANLNAFFNALFQHLRIPYWEIRNWPEFNEAEMKEALMLCKGNHPFETLIRVVYSQYHSYFPKNEILIIGDKNPVYSNQVGLLCKIFPEARFIHLTRDHRDNLVSMLDVDFEMPNAALLAYRWKYSWRKIRAAASAAPERFFTLRYEDLVADAPGRFSDLCRFLGIPYEASIFDFHKKKDEVRKIFSREIIDRYFKSLFNPIDSSRVGIYRNRLSRRQIRIADAVAGKAVEEAGYVREYPGFRPGTFLWTLPAVCYAKWLYTVGWMVSLLPYDTMMWLLNKPSVLVRAYSALVRKK